MSEYRGSAASKPPRWDSYLKHKICVAFGVRSMRDWECGRAVLFFYGQKSRAEIAAYAYAVLGRQCAQSRKRYFDQQRKSVKRTTRIARADSFAEAWAISATRMLRGLVETDREQALLAQYEGQHWPNLQPLESRAAKKARGDDRAAEDGFAAGRHARLDVAVGGSQERGPEMIGHD